MQYECFVQAAFASRLLWLQPEEPVVAQDDSELVDSAKLEAQLEETTKELDRVVADKVCL